MTNKRTRKKRALNRAGYNNPGGSLMYVPPGTKNSTYSQTFYGSQTKNTPVGQMSLFSPGRPLDPQAGVNPGGLPIAFRYPIAYNSFINDRTLGNQELPSFEQLRNLAKMHYGIALCEQFILRMVLKLQLQIVLTPEAIAEGAEEKDYKKEIKYFRNWFKKPDNNKSIYEWVQQALIEQTQIDELYVYRSRNRRGDLLGLEIVDGAQMKQLLDDWGRLPDKPKYAYQQFPWGIPGWLYTTDHFIHRRETPATDTPYGRSQVERTLLITNLALSKIRQDMGYFKRNVPAGILMPPGDGQWTPDQLDAYQQSLDAMLAGNLDLLSSIRVVQPGFTYTPFAQPSLDGTIDRFWLNICASVYGVPMDSLGFTETSNRSTGQMQKDVLYEQTIGPFVATYEQIFTDCLQNDFEPSLHGDLFMVRFGGYEPPEDEQSKATTLVTYTGAGILGLSAASKLAGLPLDPDAPPIGRVIMTATGPIFLDDVAQPDMRKAQQEATLAGYQLAANPPEPTTQPNEQKPANDGNKLPDDGKLSEKTGNPEEEDTKKALARISGMLDMLLRAQKREDDFVQRTPTDSEDEERNVPDLRRGTSQDAGEGAADGTVQLGATGTDPKAISAEYKRWREVALKDVKAGRQPRTFMSTLIDENTHRSIALALENCENADMVRAVFDKAREREASFFRASRLREWRRPTAEQERLETQMVTMLRELFAKSKKPNHDDQESAVEMLVALLEHAQAIGREHVTGKHERSLAWGGKFQNLMQSAWDIVNNFVHRVGDWIQEQIDGGNDDLSQEDIQTEIETVAENVSSFEIASCIEQAVLDEMEASGFERIAWGVQEGACKVCQGNADGGAIALGSTFPSGAVKPPQHNRCRCSIIAPE